MSYTDLDNATYCERCGMMMEPIHDCAIWGCGAKTCENCTNQMLTKSTKECVTCNNKSNWESTHVTGRR